MGKTITMVKVCTSCNREVTDNYIEFKCPQCKDTKLIRCLSCREINKRYTCTNCSFQGP